jgi:hypothetical protein
MNCSGPYLMKNRIEENKTWHKEISSKGGLNSVKVQNRRSKNEIYFFELCKSIFPDAVANKPIFNGWDADVIIPSIKIAILWNGPWHYKQISKSQSLEQVQNRDKIKLKEIETFGYKSHIIKDLGKYNKSFVENQFELFKDKYCGLVK